MRNAQCAMRNYFELAMGNAQCAIEVVRPKCVSKAIIIFNVLELT